MDYLTEKILNKDPLAITLAGQLGSLAGENIKPLASNDDPIVREIAVRSLNQSGGSGLTDIFINALSDEMPTIRAAALNGLNNHFSEESYQKLLQTYSQVSDSQHRNEIALLLGRFGGANINDVKQICENELSDEAREGCLAALAKLGDPQSRAEFLNRLREAENRELKRFLEYVDYIKQLWALRGLMPVLNNKNPLGDTGMCQMRRIEEAVNKAEEETAPEDKIAEILRACDIAVNLIAKIAGNKFPFPVNGAKNYTDAELAAARQVLSALFAKVEENDW